MEEKEATSTEDVEEILLEIKDKPLEPAEEVQQPDEEEPEVMPQEALPGTSQLEKTTSPGESAFQEWMRNMMESLKTDLNSKLDENSQSTKELSKKIEEGLKSSKEDNQTLKEGLSKQIESLKEGQRFTDQKLSLIHI